jgi:hypothetical protein
MRRFCRVGEPLEKGKRGSKKPAFSDFLSASCHYERPSAVRILAIEKASETAQL